jgi:hypothetical protein
MTLKRFDTRPSGLRTARDTVPDVGKVTVQRKPLGVTFEARPLEDTKPTASPDPTTVTAWSTGLAVGWDEEDRYGAGAGAGAATIVRLTLTVTGENLLDVTVNSGYVAVAAGISDVLKLTRTVAPLVPTVCDTVAQPASFEIDHLRAP